MFCGKCGAQIPDGCDFCPRCGSDLRIPGGNGEAGNTGSAAGSGAAHKGSSGGMESHTAGRAEPVRAKNSRGKIVLILAVVLILALLAGGAAVYMTSPAREVQDLIGEGSYTSAVRVYNSDVSGNFLWEQLTDSVIEECIQQARDDYENGSISYEKAESILTALSAIEDASLAEEALDTWAEIVSAESSAAVFAAAEELYNAGEYEEALEIYVQIDEDAADYETAQSRISECRELYIEDVLARASSPSTQSEYTTALALVEVALGVFPDDEDLLTRQGELTEEYYALVKSDAMAAANDAIEEDDYASAIETVNTALGILGTDSELTALLESAQSAYETYVTSEVSTLVSAGEYDDALSLIQKALNVMPESTSLDALYETTQAAQPVKLSSLTLAETDGNIELVTGQEIYTDTIGNTYGSGNLYRIEKGGSGSKEPYVKYYLGSEYTTMTFTIAVSNEDDNCKDTRTVTVYGDEDEVLYTSGEIDRTTVPIEVTVDVSGTDWIYIKADKKSYYAVPLLIYNPLLYR